MEIQSLPTLTVDKDNLSALNADKENGRNSNDFNRYLDEKLTQKNNKLTSKKEESEIKIEGNSDPLIALVLPADQLIPTLPYLSATPRLSSLNQSATLTEDDKSNLLMIDITRDEVDKLNPILENRYKGDATDLLSDMKDSTQDNEIFLDTLTKSINSHFAKLKENADLAQPETLSRAELQSLSAQQNLSSMVQETASERFLNANIKVNNINPSEKHQNSDFLFSLNNLNSYQSISNPTASASLTAPYQSNEWQDQFQQQILLFNKNQLKEAELRLHPAELGSIQIKMKMESQQAHFQFISMHESVGAAIRHALPDLKHALLQQGIDLTHADVLNGNNLSFSQQHAGSQHNRKDNNYSYQNQQLLEKPLNLNISQQHSAPSSRQNGVSIFI